MTMDAVQYETGLRRTHIRDLLSAFKEDVSGSRFIMHGTIVIECEHVRPIIASRLSAPIDSNMDMLE
jgi:hypothetical protein